MTRSNDRKLCSSKLFFHIVDCLALLLIIVLQGSILDYYLILHNGGSASWYFWFLADFLILIAFMAAAVISYRHYWKEQLKQEESSHDLQNSKLGILPFIYIVWIFYSLLLIAKVILLFKLEVAQSLDGNATFGPQLLKVVIASAAVVFLLLVETHNNTKPHSDSQAYIYFLITSTVFEIFDSVTFLGVLFPNDSKIILPFHLENAVLLLSCANFLLPALALYKLSISEFGLKTRSLGLQLLYKILHLVIINIPYFSIRVYLWKNFDHDVTLFVLKNALAIFLSLRTAFPDFQLWLQMLQESPHSNTMKSSDISAVYEITDIHLEKPTLDEDQKKIVLTTQL